MTTLAESWDYLIVTASNDRQAAAYDAHLKLRVGLGMLSGVGEVLVAGDPQGRRVGSGGSTVACLLDVLNRELADADADARANPDAWRDILARRRILIVHGGGDSKRLLAYGPCGKVFIPVPGPTDAAIPKALFDRQLPAYMGLPSMPDGAGQVVIVAGDDLKLFDPRSVRWAGRGVTALGCYTTPEEVSTHGGFSLAGDNSVRRYLQKVSPGQQARLGAIDSQGRAILDAAVMNFDAPAAAAMLRMCDVAPDCEGRLAWTGPIGEGIMQHGLDLFSDICCAMGTETTRQDYVQAIRAIGGAWSDDQLAKMFKAISPVPMSTVVLDECGFLHFGTTIELIRSGEELHRRDDGAGAPGLPLDVNNDVAETGKLTGSGAWVEGCRIRAELQLAGENVITGIDVDEPLAAPHGMCLDVLEGAGPAGRAGWFIRCYGSRDTFKDSVADGATFCNVPVLEWLESVGATGADVWPADLPPEEQTLWTAKIVPAAAGPADYKDWLWMFDPASASEDQKQAFKDADRYSLDQIALLADQGAFHARRSKIAAADRARRLPELLRPHSGFSARDLAELLRHADDTAAVADELLRELAAGLALKADANIADFSVSRILHGLGSAVLELAGDEDAPLTEVIGGMGAAVSRIRSSGADIGNLLPDEHLPAVAWAREARAAAVRHLGDAILSSGRTMDQCPSNALGPDQYVWARAPVRLELGGGWTDTPPYTLEFGGAVLNAAVNLNGRAPIQTFFRVIDEPVIRIGSIDIGTRVEISELDGLLDYRRPGNEFALVMAALALSGFAPASAPWPDGVTLRQMLETFGGGIEISTLAGVPKGSGLGTSSILGAVILAAIHRAMGSDLGTRELFHKVLQLEQALTTGGGWQDQIGGMVEGKKITETQPGAVPDPDVTMVPSDVLDPELNGGSTILYYTGLTRLAKNILEQIVGRYLDRDRATMEALAQEYMLAHEMAETMARRDAKRFGELIDVAWLLQQKLCRDVTNKPIEELLSRVRPHIHGARILGAGSGGFLLMICKSPQDATAIKKDLLAKPLNDQACFFDFDMSREGLVVAVCEKQGHKWPPCPA